MEEFEMKITCHDSWGDEDEAHIYITKSEEDMLQIYIPNNGCLYKDEVLKLIEGLKQAVEVIE